MNSKDSSTNLQEGDIMCLIELYWTSAIVQKISAL